MSVLVVRGPATVAGTLTVPGDKSIAHRALMLAATADGRSTLRGLPLGEDVLSTARCLEGLGAGIERDAHTFVVDSPGIDRWTTPGDPLDCGNSGTTMRILSGLVARRPGPIVLDGDASLRSRPMERIAEPLRLLGASVQTTDGHAPVRIEGGGLVGQQVRTAVASAQVKSAVLLAGLGADGATSVVEPHLSRDHTERLLRSLGIEVLTEMGTPTRVDIRAAGVPPFDLDVPGDPSSAAFLVAAGLLAGEARVEGVCLNPTRIGFLQILERMGGEVATHPTGEEGGEPVGSITARRTELEGIGLTAADVPASIDELPLLAVVATQAEGVTEVRGAGELRVKESDRVAATVEGIVKLGGRATETEDGFVIEGPTPLRGADVDAHGDHRIAMAMAVAGLAAEGETRVHGAAAARISWPGFEDALRALGADVEVIG